MNISQRSIRLWWRPYKLANFTDCQRAQIWIIYSIFPSELKCGNCLSKNFLYPLIPVRVVFNYFDCKFLQSSCILVARWKKMSTEKQIWLEFNVAPMTIHTFIKRQHCFIDVLEPTGKNKRRLNFIFRLCSVEVKLVLLVRLLVAI